MPQFQEKLRVVNGNLSAFEKASDDDLKKLDDRRTAITNTVNGLIDEEKRKREECGRNEGTEMQKQSCQLNTKIEYLKKMTTCLDSNIDAYNDYDLLEMDQEMTKTLQEVESYDVSPTISGLKFVPGKINKHQIKEMIGDVKKTSTSRTKVSTM